LTVPEDLKTAEAEEAMVNRFNFHRFQSILCALNMSIQHVDETPDDEENQLDADAPISTSITSSREQQQEQQQQDDNDDAMSNVEKQREGNDGDDDAAAGDSVVKLGGVAMATDDDQNDDNDDNDDDNDHDADALIDDEQRLTPEQLTAMRQALVRIELICFVILHRLTVFIES
jgi:hypothetical protein